LALQIGSAALDLDRGTLRRDGEIVQIRPKTLELLAYLARNPGRVLSKEELLEAVWRGIHVSEDSLTQSIRDARKSIGDEAQLVIRTVPRRGYLLQAPEVEAVQPPTADALRAEPMVAVLPFRVDPADTTGKALFDGAVEEITNALSCFKTIAVLARHSAIALAQQSGEELRSTAQRLGIDYIAEGRVESGQAEHAARIELFETTSGRRAWGQSFSFTKGEIFSFHMLVARRISTALLANIESAVMRRGLVAGPTANIEAYLQFLRGRELLRSYGEGVNHAARDHFLKAIELDPASGLAHAYLALADVIIGGYGDAPRDVLDQARDRSLHAIALSPDEARCHRILALTLLYRGRDEYDSVEEHFARALDLNPYDADTLAQTGYLRALRGDAKAGLELLDKAIQLNPIHPSWYYHDRGEALLIAGRYGDAAASFARLPRKSAWQWARLALCHAVLGEGDKALACVKEGHALVPDLTIAQIVTESRMERAQDREVLRRGLERAGWDATI
jgi:DNA-binding winged helix-turn-helix (wHTH) protein/tetratricopeptide (TPR) repeat protein